MQFTIENAAEHHIPAILTLMREFAEYEDLSSFLEVNAEQLSDVMFGSSAFVNGLVAFTGLDPVGYVLFYPHFSSFRGQRGFYIEDIYVAQDKRGKGVGEALIREVARRAKSRGFERIDFLVLEKNKKAVDFYLKLGAGFDDQERHFKFTDSAFEELASDMNPS